MRWRVLAVIQARVRVTVVAVTGVPAGILVMLQRHALSGADRQRRLRGNADDQQREQD